MININNCTWKIFKVLTKESIRTYNANFPINCNYINLIYNGLKNLVNGKTTMK